MITYNIFNLIDYTSGEIVPYEPRLAPRVAEIVSAEARGAEAAKLAVRERLQNTLPVTRPVIIESRAAQALAGELWPGVKEGQP